MTAKKKADSKRRKIRVKDMTASPNERSTIKAEKDDPKGGYNITQAWPKKY